MSIENPAACGTDTSNDISIPQREKAVITDDMTVAQLKKLPLADVIDVLAPVKHTAVAQFGPKGNIFFRTMRFDKAGSKVDGHVHNFDHVTYLRKGSLNVIGYNFNYDTREMTNRVEYNYTAPAAVLIKAGLVHELTALEDGTEADCIYAVRSASTGEVIDNWDGSLKPYE